MWLMASGRTETMADVVGLITLGFGVVLTVAPRRSAAVLGLGNRPVLATVVGMTDLVVGSGVLWGRRRWPWMTARAALNLALAACYGAEANRTGGGRRARAGIIAMGSLTVVDAVLALALAARTAEEEFERQPAEGAHIAD
jgi:hypothetical protein